MKRVVITGLGTVSPVGNTVKQAWESLIAGKVGIGPITRFDTSDLKASLAGEVKDFDPAICMDKADIRRSDLYTRYAIVAAQEAMDDSGLDLRNSSRLGVYVGSGIGGIATLIVENEKMEKDGPRRVSPFLIPMMIANMAAGQIAIRFGARGPSLPVVTACATGTHAIGEAYRAIAHGYADAIITGGAEAPILPLAIAGFGNRMALTGRDDPQAASVPFDRRRDGFVMGEGAGILVLEELEHAKARGANIHAEVVGYGNSCDAFHITAPLSDGAAATQAIQMAWAGIPKDRQGQLYINAHGTSTPLNDKTETLAIKQALGEERAYKAAISSTKSMTGHMLGAAGGFEAIAAVKTLKEGIAPPTMGLLEPDPECDLDYIPNTARAGRYDAALSISLGFGGHNACVAFARWDDPKEG